MHSTNGAKGSAYTSEVLFLYNSVDVSSHYIISKAGDITQFFDDITKYRAWHTGAVRDPIYNNNNSIGIECHFTPGETPYLPEMQQALTDLVLSLRKQYVIVDIETHRNVAIPKGRKVDPSHMPDSEFYVWKERVMSANLDEKTPIIGHVNANIDVLRDKLLRKGVLSYEIAPIVSAYTTFGEITRMGNVYPLAQWADETGWGKSDRWNKARNPAGLGATNDGAWGSTFASISEGILAQYAHLLCYSTTPQENSYSIEQLAQLSPRKTEMQQAFGRGSARMWEQLNGKWAFPGDGYAEKIKDIARYFTT